MKYQKNQPLVDLASFRHYWRGIPKIGKTSLFRDLVLEAYGDARFGLLISTWNETGYRALSELFAVEASTWEEFVETVDDLVENKSENEFRIIGIDTVDELVSIASDKVLKVHFQRKGERAQTLNQCLGGYGAGHVMVQNLINDQIKRLESASYGLVFIGHTKVKDVKEKGAEEAYQQLTGNMESRFDNIFTNKADIVATLVIDKNIKDERLLETNRYIYFRPNGFVDAGSRFANMPERISLSAKEYLKAFMDGVKSSFSSNVTDKEIEKIRNAELKEKEEKAVAFVEKSKTGDVEHAGELHTVEDYRKLIDEKLSEYDKETKNQKRAELKEKGIPTNFKELEDIEVLKTILKVVSSK